MRDRKAVSVLLAGVAMGLLVATCLIANRRLHSACPLFLPFYSLFPFQSSENASCERGGGVSGVVARE